MHTTNEQRIGRQSKKKNYDTKMKYKKIKKHNNIFKMYTQILQQYIIYFYPITCILWIRKN